ncbi:MAG: hypothetical protein JWM68_2148 [Verrucomicrobiales bacterium]|nr:hypothetical protein [Verrucomicrobiales bacterium]
MFISSGLNRQRRRLNKFVRTIRNLSVLPHPNLLPLGEGTADARCTMNDAFQRNLALAFATWRELILPLPVGEGRGEGEAQELD